MSVCETEKDRDRERKREGKGDAKEEVDPDSVVLKRERKSMEIMW